MGQLSCPQRDTLSLGPAFAGYYGPDQLGPSSRNQYTWLQSAWLGSLGQVTCRKEQGWGWIVYSS